MTQRAWIVARLAGSPAQQALARTVAIGLMVLAFALQGFTTQTHIHFSSRVLPAFAAQTAIPAVQQDGGAGNPDATDCPICREIGLAGYFVTSAAASVAAPVAFTAVVFAATATPAFTTPKAHAWHSRGPPATL